MDKFGPKDDWFKLTLNKNAGNVIGLTNPFCRGLLKVFLPTKINKPKKKKENYEVALSVTNKFSRPIKGILLYGSFLGPKPSRKANRHGWRQIGRSRTISSSYIKETIESKASASLKTLMAKPPNDIYGRTNKNDWVLDKTFVSIVELETERETLLRKRMEKELSPKLRQTVMDLFQEKKKPITNSFQLDRSNPEMEKSLKQLYGMGKQALPAIPFIVELMVFPQRQLSYNEKKNLTNFIASHKAMAVEGLNKLLNPENTVICLGVISILREIKAPASVQTLIQLLKSENKGILNSVVQALQHNTGKYFGNDHSKWEQWYKAKYKM